MQGRQYNWSRELYERHGETINTYLTNNVLLALRDKTGQGGTVFLTELQRQWNIFGVFAHKVNRIFLYLERYYTKHHSLPTLPQVCDLAFRTKVYEPLRDDVREAILGYIGEERNRLETTSTVAAAAHHGMDHSLLHPALKVYEKYHGDNDHKLEQTILESTRAYYLEKRNDWITCVDYFAIVKTAIEQEEKHFGTEILNGIGLKIKAFLEEELIDDQQSVLAFALLSGQVLF